ncbi:hypothetical protein OG912_32240 [Streptomyces sp. NBC_00464]|uniref:hypothetical protein n=1 Tax=Streptomyces sp. NBC_00464 TaxID=2975751 RepID=UPI002E188AE8
MRKTLAALALAGALTLTACSAEDQQPAGCYEIDIDHPKTHRTAPAFKTPKKSAPKAPSTTRRR